MHGQQRSKPHRRHDMLRFTNYLYLRRNKNPKVITSSFSHPTIMQSQIWASSIPLHITHHSSPTPYLISVPRLSYLPLLLPRLTSFFGTASSFSYQQIPLKTLPVGLLYDLYKPELPWRLELENGLLFDVHDTYINSVKEVRSETVSYGRAVD